MASSTTTSSAYLASGIMGQPGVSATVEMEQFTEARARLPAPAVGPRGRRVATSPAPCRAVLTSVSHRSSCLLATTSWTSTPGSGSTARGLRLSSATRAGSWALSLPVLARRPEVGRLPGHQQHHVLDRSGQGAGRGWAVLRGEHARSPAQGPSAHPPPSNGKWMWRDQAGPDPAETYPVRGAAEIRQPVPHPGGGPAQGDMR